MLGFSSPTEDAGFSLKHALRCGCLLAYDKITCKWELGEIVPAAGLERVSCGPDSARFIRGCPAPLLGGSRPSPSLSLSR